MARSSLSGSLKYQRGAVTLLVSLIMLVSMSILAVVMAKSSVVELKAGSNLERSRQATEAAEAALDQALAYFKVGGADQTGGPGNTSDGVADGIFAGSTTGTINGRVVTAQFCALPGGTLAPNDFTCTAPTDMRNVMIVASGRSDDQMAVHRVRVNMAYYDFAGAGPPVPLTAQAITNMTGNMKVTNNESNFTVWTGDPPSALGAQGSFETRIRINGVPDQLSTVKGNQALYTLGPDFLHSDPNLKNTTPAVNTPEKLFESLFGMTLAQAQALADVYVPGGGTITGQPQAGKVVYVDGDLTFGGASELGELTGPNNNRDCANYSAPPNPTGPQPNPTLLIVNGDLRMTGGTICGVVFARRVENGAGNATIRGSLITADFDSGAGTLHLDFRNFSGAGNAPPFSGTARLIGSWRDW